MTESTAPADTAVALDNSPELALPALHRAVIGPMGEDYYLPVFNRFEAGGEATLSWNWSACLFSVNWVLFRGMWRVALVFAAVMLGMLLLLFGLDQLVFAWPPEVLYGLIATGLSLGLLVPGAWGNALFFNHSRKAMMAAIDANPTLELACTQLRQQASSRGRLIRILVGNLALLAAAALAYTLLLPQAGLSFGPTAIEKTTEFAAETTSGPAAEPAKSASQAAGVVTELVSAELESPAREASVTASESASAGGVYDLAGAAPAAALSSAPAAVAEPIAPAVPAASAIAIAKPATQGKPHKVAKAPKAAVDNGFFVNAGLFAQPGNARNTLAKLKVAGLPAFSQQLQTPQGPRTRVRVGPFAKRAQAEAAVKKIRALKLDAALAKP